MREVAEQEMLTYILLALLLIVLTGTAFQLFGRYLYNYRLTDDSIQLVVAGVVPVMTIRYAEIARIREASFGQALKSGLFTLRLGNRIIGGIVLIQRKKGLIRSILLTPDDVPTFLRQVAQHVDRR